MRAKKLLSLLLSAVMLLSVVNVTFASDTVNYIDENGSGAKCTKYIRMESVSENCTLTGGWYLVSGNITIGEDLFISSGEVNLILEDRGTLEVGKGITIESGANLNVYAQSDGENAGKLKSGNREMISEDNYAYIFGIIGEGDFTVNGGNIEISAKINKNYAYNVIYGINVQNVTVNGGSLTVNIADIQPSEEDAESKIEYGQTFGIMAESITVNGGSLKTTAGKNTTESGVSFGLYGNYITVSGGKVEAGCSEAEFSSGFYSSSSMKVTDGKIKELCINLYTNGIELSGGEYEKIRVENGKSFASAVKTGYGYVDNSGNAVDIDKSSTLENVKVVKGDFPYSQQNGGAKITTASESYYVNNADDLMKALTDKNTVEIKLFEDFNYGGEIAEDNILIESPRLLMDLNGYDFYIYTEAVLNLNSEFVLADSSKNKNGRFTAYNVNCDEEMIYDEDLIGYIQPKITISGGELYTAYASFIGADVTVSGGKLTIYNYSSGCIFEYGTLRLTDGVIDGLIMMNSGSVLDIRGGKIKGDKDGNNNGLICIDCTGSISGGETDFMEFTGDAQLNITGGSFGKIKSSDGTLISSLINSDHNAYKGSEVVNADVEELDGVYVAEHICSFDENGKCSCGKEENDNTDAPEDAVVKVVYRAEDGSRKIGYPTTMKEFKRKGCEAEEITLLKDLKNSTKELANLYDQKNLTLDLNGFTLDFNSTPEGKGWCYGNIDIEEDMTLTVKDGSKGKTGVLNIDSLETAYSGKLILESGTINCNEASDIFGGLEIKGGIISFAEEVISAGGRITVSGGTLKSGDGIILLNAGAVNLVSADGEAEENDKTAYDTGDSMLISGGKVLGTINVNEYTSLKITGGEAETVTVEYGSLDISGGKISNLRNGIDGENIIRLSGGTFGKIYYEGVEASDMLSDSYAYYKRTGSDYTTVTAPLTKEEAKNQNIEYLEDVQVKKHACSFNGDGICECGRKGKANTSAVAYLAEDGKTAYCRSYEFVSSETTVLKDGWYVVSDGVTIENTLKVSGKAKLILTDKSTLTVKKALMGSSIDGEITVYAQSVGNNCGELVVEGEKYENYGSNGICIENLTINGGRITAEAVECEADEAYLCAAGVTVSHLTMNGGELTAKGKKVKSANDGKMSKIDAHSVGIYCNGINLNGGSIKAYAADTETGGKGAYAGSYGIYAAENIVAKGGSIYGEGGNARVSGNNDENDEVMSRSIGVVASIIEVNDGEVKAKGKNAEMTREDEAVSSKDKTGSYGIYSGYCITYGGNVTAEAASATGESGAAEACGLYGGSGIYAYGGTITATKGSAKTSGDIKTRSDYAISIIDGTLKSSRTGGAVSVTGNGSLYIYGGSIKIEDGYFTHIMSQNNVITSYLGENKRYYNEDDDENCQYLPDADKAKEAFGVYAADTAAELYVYKGDVIGSRLDISQYHDFTDEKVTYIVGGYDEEKIEVTCDENGKLTVRAKSKAEEGVSCFVPVTVETQSGRKLVFVEIKPRMLYDDDDTPVEGPSSNNNNSNTDSKNDNNGNSENDANKENNGNSENGNSNDNGGNSENGNNNGSAEIGKKEFIDVHGVGHWSQASVDYIVKKGIMKGVSENEFEPESELTRAMLVTALYRLDGEPEVGEEDGFTDIAGDEYYAKAVAWAKQNGIVNGISDDLFAPNESITREQLAAIIYRYAVYKGYDVSVAKDTNILSYEDFGDISEYAVEAVQYAVGAGIIEGKTASTLNPKDFAKRGEIAAVLQRFIEFTEK